MLFPPLSDLWHREILKPFCAHSVISGDFSPAALGYLVLRVVEGFLGPTLKRSGTLGRGAAARIGTTAWFGFAQKHPSEG